MPSKSKPKSTTCSICCDNIHPKDNITGFDKCVHIFHTKCITPYNENYKKQCPNCRKKSELVVLNVNKERMSHEEKIEYLKEKNTTSVLMSFAENGHYLKKETYDRLYQSASQKMKDFMKTTWYYVENKYCEINSEFDIHYDKDKDKPNPPKECSCKIYCYYRYSKRTNYWYPGLTFEKVNNAV